jgi:prolyl-tRNA synthetase
MLAKARVEFNAHTIVVTEWKNFVKTLNGNNICVVPWCEKMECEEEIKKRSAQEYVPSLPLSLFHTDESLCA